MQILVQIGLLYFVKKTKLFISIASVLSMFLKKLKSLLVIKTWFIDFMLAGKTLIDYTALFSPNDFNKNDQIILSYIKGA